MLPWIPWDFLGDGSEVVDLSPGYIFGNKQAATDGTEKGSKYWCETPGFGGLIFWGQIYNPDLGKSNKLKKILGSRYPMVFSGIVINKNKETRSDKLGWL